MGTPRPGTSAITDELYRSETIVVRRLACADQSRWVITFDNYDIGPGFARRGFGEDFLQEEGISAIHIMGRGNDWYHYPDVMDAADVVAKTTAAAKRRVAYGSSMGGFAALRLADAVGADAVLACSPQYSIDPAVVPWETRWIEHAQRLNWIEDLRGPIKCRCRPVVVFDPTGPDRRYVALIDADVPTAMIEVPYGGHPVTTLLAKTGVLKSILMQILDGTFSADAVATEIRIAKRRSASYFATLAEQQPSSRINAAIAIARAATERFPDDLLGYRMLARLLSKAGHHRESLKVSEYAVRHSGREILYLITYAESLARAGKAEAPLVAWEVVRQFPDLAHLRHWYTWVLALDGNLDAAIAEEEKALALHQDYPQYFETLLRYRELALRWKRNDRSVLRRTIRRFLRFIKRYRSYLSS